MLNLHHSYFITTVTEKNFCKFVAEGRKVVQKNEINRNFYSSSKIIFFNFETQYFLNFLLEASANLINWNKLFGCKNKLKKVHKKQKYSHSSHFAILSAMDLKLQEQKGSRKGCYFYKLFFCWMGLLRKVGTTIYFFFLFLFLAQFSTSLSCTNICNIPPFALQPWPTWFIVR